MVTRLDMQGRKTWFKSYSTGRRRARLRLLDLVARRIASAVKALKLTSMVGLLLLALLFGLGLDWVTDGDLDSVRIMSGWVD